MVNSKEEAQQVIESVYYPPKGKRGVGLSRAHKYGIGFEDYKEWLKKECVIVVQIEHIDAVKNLKEIMSLPEIDAFFVGPYDLSGSLDVPGEFDNPKVKKALEEVKSHLKDYCGGIHVVPPVWEDVNKKIDEGYRFIAYSTDYFFLGDSARKGIENIKKELKKNKDNDGKK